MVLENFQKIPSSTIIPIIIILTLISLWILTPILTIVIFGAILAYYVRHITKKIKPYVKNDSLSVFLGMIILAIPLILLLYFTFSQFVNIAGSFFGSLQQAATGNSTMQMAQINDAVQNLDLPNNISVNITDTIKSGISQFISYTASSVVNLVSSIPGIAAQILILIFSMFYFAKDGDKIVKYVKDIIPAQDQDFYQQIIDSADDVLKSIIVGNLIPAIILGILSGILYYFLGYEYVILLAIISGIAMFIPIIGPWIVYGVIGIFSILIGNTLPGVLVIVFGWIIETSTDFYIRPRIAVQYSEIHPLVFLLGFIYGAVTMGLPGLFIGPLILGITYEAYKVYRKEKVKSNP
ncbi:AI-2E family transporter [Methanobacterium petrolearium]|uniref:AI-2E family transporter n=1 Tax=Methanobacterium petrolearium TaxID=710190 RepID=UPI001AEA93E6|nr:AI-2E family transporter [Methanobacterium petrolearium]MBP1946357.1 putative PurR-regulated permease PerM [Methanobacterium petrolearium]BDZ70623.1 AI-2E family transporter [Methanobacterium petrolearium]